MGHWLLGDLETDPIVSCFKVQEAALVTLVGILACGWHSDCGVLEPTGVAPLHAHIRFLVVLLIVISGFQRTVPLLFDLWLIALLALSILRVALEMRLEIFPLPEFARWR